MNLLVQRTFEDMPSRIAALPLSKLGFPIPYFAEEVNGERDFRVVSAVKMAHAVRNDLCWVCGERMGKFKAFVIGPMCGINRTISDPPSHRDCAIFSAKNCPFLSRPLAKRRIDGLPEDATDAASFGLKRNPGAVGVWITKSYRPFRPGAGKSGILFRLGDPEEVLWFTNGHIATRDEVQASVDSGLPSLWELAELDGEDGKAALTYAITQLAAILPPV